MNLRYNADGTCNCKPLGGGCFFTHPYDDSKPCDCKCHMSTHNTREGIEECLPTEEDLQKVGDHYWGGDYEPPYQELIHLKQSFKEILTPKIEKFLHQELQKAREEERDRIIYVTKNIKDAFMSPLTERRWLQCIQFKFKDQPTPKDQSELDQPKQ